MDERAELPSNPNEDGSKDILGATIFIISLATLTVLARLYVRVSVIRNTGWDVGLPFPRSLLFVRS
jgi:hypothetical protein